MISLLMTHLVMGCVVMDISKEAFMVGKRFSMVVADLEVKQLNISVEKMSALLQRIILPFPLHLLHVLPFHLNHLLYHQRHPSHQ